MSTPHQPAASDERAEQYDLFALDGASAPPAALLPALATAPPKTPVRTRGKATTTPRLTAPPPTRLDIAPMPEPPAIPPLQLAAARLALCQALAEQAQVAYQSFLASQSDDQTRPSIDIPPDRIVAAAQLLNGSPALNAAVCLLALEGAQT